MRKKGTATTTEKRINKTRKILKMVKEVGRVEFKKLKDMIIII